MVRGRVEMEMKMGLRRERKSAAVCVMVVGICRRWDRGDWPCARGRKEGRK